MNTVYLSPEKTPFLSSNFEFLNNWLLVLEQDSIDSSPLTTAKHPRNNSTNNYKWTINAG